MFPVNLNKLVHRTDLFRYVGGYQYIKPFVSVLHYKDPGRVYIRMG